MTKNSTLFVRPEIVVEPNRNAVAEVQRPLSAFEAIYRISWIRKTAILLVLALIWEIIARIQDNDLLLPSFVQTAHAFVDGVVTGELIGKVWISLKVLVKGYLIGIALAFGLTTLAVSTQLGRDLLSTLTSMFNPLPAIAMLPLALLWFGLGENSLIFVLVH
ncbi:ABC transporter permease, partial [Streptomyces sp. A1136]